ERWSAVGFAQPRVAGGNRGARGLPGDTELDVDVREVALDSPDADEEPRGDLLVTQSGGDELQDVELAVAEPWQPRGDRGLRGSEEGVDLREEIGPGRLVAQEDVVDRVER